jgi:hypothetical protein
MVVDSGRMRFFFGAGASAEFGIPLMRKMGEDFKSIINKQDLEEQEIYNEIVGTLKDDMGPDVDIEAIFSVIDGLQDYNIENIGELSIYISKKFFKDSLLGKNIASKTMLQSLKKDFQRFIRRSCALKSPYRTKMEDVFTGFFNTIGETVNSPDGHSVKHDTRWTLFTTNYDRCLEAFWRENVRITLDTGFRDKSGVISPDGTLHADNFLHSFGGELQFQRVGRSGRLRLEASWLYNMVNKKRHKRDRGKTI